MTIYLEAEARLSLQNNWFFILRPVILFKINVYQVCFSSAETEIMAGKLPFFQTSVSPEKERCSIRKKVSLHKTCWDTIWSLEYHWVTLLYKACACWFSDVPVYILRLLLSGVAPLADLAFQTLLATELQLDLGNGKQEWECRRRGSVWVFLPLFTCIKWH